MTFPSKSDSNEKWGDDEPTPIKSEATPSATEASPSTKEGGGLEGAQTDGAPHVPDGSSALVEPEFDVEVKLSDLQADPNNPLYSAKTFEQLNLLVSRP